MPEPTLHFPNTWAVLFVCLLRFKLDAEDITYKILSFSALLKATQTEAAVSNVIDKSDHYRCRLRSGFLRVMLERKEVIARMATSFDPRAEG